MDKSAEYWVDVVWGIIKRITRWTFFFGIAVLLLYALYMIRSVILSIFTAVLLTYILLPGVDWLCRKPNRKCNNRTQRLIATLLVFVVFLTLIAAMISLFVAPFSNELTDFVRSIGQYQTEISKLITKVSRAVPPSVKGFISQQDFSRVGGFVVNYAQGVLKFATSSIRALLELVLIPVLAFYFVWDYKTISRELYGLIPKNKRKDAVRMGRITGEIFQSYIFGQLILCIIAGILTGIVLAVLDVKYVVVLALFAGITRAIPVIGPVLSGIPIVLVGTLGNNTLDIPLGLYLLIFVIVMHFAESKFLMPQLIGHKIHLHPALVIIVLLVGAEFFGLVGMFLAAPIAAIIRDLLRIYYIKPRDRKIEIKERVIENKAESKVGV